MRLDFKRSCIYVFLILSLFSILAPSGFAASAAPSQTPSEADPSAVTSAEPTPGASNSPEQTLDVVDNGSQNDGQTPDCGEISLALDNSEAVQVYPNERINLSVPLSAAGKKGQDGQTYIKDLTIKPVISDDLEAWPFETENLSYARHLPDMELGSHIEAVFDLRVSPTASAGAKELTFTVAYCEWIELDGVSSQTFEVVDEIKVPIVVLQADKSGKSLVLFKEQKSPATAREGENVKITLDLVNKGADLTDITIAPKISNNESDNSSFPFLVDGKDYTKNLPNMRSGDVASVEFQIQLLPETAAGLKNITFLSRYSENGVVSENEFVYQLEVLPAETAKAQITNEPQSTDSAQPEPQVVLSSYTVYPEKPLAGSEFELTLTLKNTSDTEGIKDLELKLEDLAGIVELPDDPNAAISIDSIPAGETVTHSIKLKSSNSADEEKHDVRVGLGYKDEQEREHESNQTLSITLKQPVKAVVSYPKVDSSRPIVEGEPVDVNIAVHNVGKGTIHNVGVDVVGGGVSVDSSQTGDKLPPGEQVYLRISVLPMRSGAIDSTLRVSYQGSDGETLTEDVPLTLSVQAPKEQFDPPPVEKKPATGLYIALAAVTAIVIGTGVFFIIKLIKQKNMY